MYRGSPFFPEITNGQKNEDQLKFSFHGILHLKRLLMLNGEDTSPMENDLELGIQSHLGNLIKQGKMIEAIAFVQNKLRLGLKNSKDLVEVFCKVSSFKFRYHQEI